MRHVSALRLVVVLPMAALLLVSCATGPQSTATPTAQVRELINPGESLAEASRFGDLVFTAGFLGDAPGDDFGADVDDALNRLETALHASGAGFDTLLKVNVYLTDWDNWETFNSIYVSRIGKHGLPPRTTVEIVRLGFDAPIEIAAIAHVRTSSP
jgi:2-iminobutanoate/2-iminopropanoate deaminase